MDNLTHSLVGLFLARAGLRRMTPLGTGIMVLSANAPDFDVVSWFGSLTYIRWHRNITHSLIAIPLMAFLAVVIVRIAGRRRIRWLPAIAIGIAGVASHLILDLTNVYGVRLLLPFSGHWFHWDLTPVVDLIIWTILLIGVVAPAFGRLVGGEIGENRPPTGRGWAILALLLLTGYDYGRSVLHARAVGLMDSRIYHGLAARRTAAFPEQNPLRWRGIAELSDSYVEVPIDLRGSFDPGSAEVFYKAERTPAIDAAIGSDAFQAFLQFVQYAIWIAEPDPDIPGLTQVRLIDLRFGTPRQPGFEAIASVNKRGQVLKSLFTFGAVRPR